MKRTNPLFLEDEEPEDALYKIGYLLRFIREVQGYERNDLSLSSHAKEGFCVLLGTIENAIRQVACSITEEKEENKKIKKKKKSRNSPATSSH